MKKGQVTLFIILGIIIITLIAFLLFIRSESLSSFLKSISERARVVPPEFKPQAELIRSCLNGLGKDGLNLLGMQGGYIKVSGDPAVNYIGLNVAYLNYNSKNMVPSLRFMESELENYIAQNAKDCLINMSDVKIIRAGDIDANVDILNDKVSFNINWDIDIEKDDLKFQLSNFKYDVPVRLGELRDIINVMVDRQISDRDTLCLSCIVDDGIKNNLYIQMYTYNEDLIFVINDPKSVFDDRQYKFIFASRF
ncbi:MAG: hypothetical protein AB1571_02260 [Nanoarchaeota archaeon]